MVQYIGEKSGKEVIRNRKGKCSTNGVVGPDIAQDGELGRYFHVGNKKRSEELGEWATVDPLVDRMKDLPRSDSNDWLGLG